MEWSVYSSVTGEAVLVVAATRHVAWRKALRLMGPGAVVSGVEPAWAARGSR